MSAYVRIFLFLAAALAAVIVAVFLVKLIIVFAFVAAVIFAAIYLYHFACALYRRMNAPREPAMLSGTAQRPN